MSKNQRQNWGAIYTKKLPELDLVGLQLDSYKDFLNSGIQETLQEIYSEGGIEDQN